MYEKRAELRDVTLVLPRWEAVHATGGGQLGAELRDDYCGGVPPQSKAADWVGSTIGKFDCRNAENHHKACPTECR